MYHRKDPVETAAVEKHVRDMIGRALAMEGTSTVSRLFKYVIFTTADRMQGEHSIGFFKKHELLQEVGAETIGVMKAIKQSLDPYWLMNPGKIFDTPAR
jgi:D-lactate dehydrogenase (cytochrome)